MTRDEFIEVLKEKDVPFHDAKDDFPGKEYDGIYVFSRKEYVLKHNYPRKYQNLYVPYIRVSNFDGEWYTRENGWCCHMATPRVLEIVNEYAK